MQNQDDKEPPRGLGVFWDQMGEMRYYDPVSGMEVFPENTASALNSADGQNFFSLDDVTYKEEPAKISAVGQNPLITLTLFVKPGYQLKFSYEGYTPLPGTYVLQKVTYRHPENSLWPFIHPEYVWLLDRNNESKVHIYDARNSGRFSGTYEIALYYYAVERRYRYAKTITGGFSAVFKE